MDNAQYFMQNALSNQNDVDQARFQDGANDYVERLQQQQRELLNAMAKLETGLRQDNAEGKDLREEALNQMGDVRDSAVRDLIDLYGCYTPENVDEKVRSSTRWGEGHDNFVIVNAHADFIEDYFQRHPEGLDRPNSSSRDVGAEAEDSLNSDFVETDALFEQAQDFWGDARLDTHLIGRNNLQYVDRWMGHANTLDDARTFLEHGNDAEASRLSESTLHEMAHDLMDYYDCHSASEIDAKIPNLDASYDGMAIEREQANRHADLLSTYFEKYPEQSAPIVSDIGDLPLHGEGTFQPDLREGDSYTQEDVSRMEHDEQYAQLSNAVYYDSISPAGWSIEKEYHSPTGLDAKLFVNDASGERVLAFRGTELNLENPVVDHVKDGADNQTTWIQQKLEELTPFSSILDSVADIANALNDASPLAGGMPVQYYEASVLALHYASRNEGLTLTGHSLGGGLALYSSLVTGCDAVTFNPAEVSQSLDMSGKMLDAFRGDKPSRRNYIVKGEILDESFNKWTPTADLPGDKYMIGREASDNTLQEQGDRHSRYGEQGYLHAYAYELDQAKKYVGDQPAVTQGETS